MGSFKTASKNQTASDKNKPDVEKVQVLLMGSNLLIFACLFIELVSEKGLETLSWTIFELLTRATYLLARLGHVTVIFLGLINKREAYFLLPKSLSVAHSNSYLAAALTL